MPEEGAEDAIEIGYFCPGDSPEVVKELSRLRVAQLTRLSRLHLHPDNLRLVRSLEFHTYEDFLLTLKHETPKKGDPISTGHSLDGFPPTIAGYLAYLDEKAPDLARFFFAKLSVRIPESDRKRHTYIVGKSGSGKSELLKLLLYSYIRKPDYCTTILVDPHGDIADEVSRFKEHRKTDRLILIDPYLDKYGKKKPCINPFDIRDRSPQNIDIVAQALLGAFKELLQNTSLTTQMEALLVPCLTVLLKREGSTLLDLQRFMNDDKNDDLVQLGAQSDIRTHRLFFQDRFYERTFTITKASISTKLQSILNSQTFYHLTVGQSTVLIDEVLNSRKLAVFNLSKGRLGSDTSEAFGRFIIALVQSAILKRASVRKAERVPVHMFIDEFQNYVSQSMKEVLAESRKYGLHLTLAQQYVGQEMDTAFKDAILTNTQIKVTGLSSNKTVTPVAREMGLDESEVLRLGVGSFFVKVGNRPVFRMYAPTFLLGNKNAMSWEDWHGVREHQLDEYYRDVDQDRPGQKKTADQEGDVRGSDPDEYLNEEKEELKPKNPKRPKYSF
jgi:hypothetical protein